MFRTPNHGYDGDTNSSPSPPRRFGTCAVVLVLVLLAAGCGGSDQSTLSPESHASSEIAQLWWVMLAASAVIFGVVLVLIAAALLRRRGPEAPPDTRAGGGLWIPAIGGVAIPIVLLVALFALTLNTLPATSPTAQTGVLTVKVTGRQWFWDVEYPGAGVRTANELHVPVGQTVNVEVTSGDVIHSFWVPELNRKIDMIPGRVNTVQLEADRAGTYRGQCAEFCGLQHAHMAFFVIAQPRAEFDRWLAAEARPAPRPATHELERGQQVFLGSACVYCHTIAGTNASGTIGPDLTHFGSRLAIGAATIPNTRGYLGGWILDPQHLKPGNKMPGTDLSGAELQVLIDYLESLR